MLNHYHEGEHVMRALESPAYFGGGYLYGQGELHNILDRLDRMEEKAKMAGPENAEIRQLKTRARGECVTRYRLAVKHGDLGAMLAMRDIFQEVAEPGQHLVTSEEYKADQSTVLRSRASVLLYRLAQRELKNEAAPHSPEAMAIAHEVFAIQAAGIPLTEHQQEILRPYVAQRNQRVGRPIALPQALAERSDLSRREIESIARIADSKAEIGASLARDLKLPTWEDERARGLVYFQVRESAASQRKFRVYAFPGEFSQDVMNRYFIQRLALDMRAQADGARDATARR